MIIYDDYYRYHIRWSSLLSYHIISYLVWNIWFYSQHQRPFQKLPGAWLEPLAAVTSLSKLMSKHLETSANHGIWAYLDVESLCFGIMILWYLMIYHDMSSQSIRNYNIIYRYIILWHTLSCIVHLPHRHSDYSWDPASWPRRHRLMLRRDFQLTRQLVTMPGAQLGHDCIRLHPTQPLTCHQEWCPNQSTSERRSSAATLALEPQGGSRVPEGIPWAGCCSLLEPSSTPQKPDLASGTPTWQWKIMENILGISNDV